MRELPGEYPDRFPRRRRCWVKHLEENEKKNENCNEKVNVLVGTLDKNLTTGGLLGYSSENSRVNLKVPSWVGGHEDVTEVSPTSKGVSWGPKMTAFHSMMLFSPGAPDTPAGGSSWMETLCLRDQILHLDFNVAQFYLEPLEVPHQPPPGCSGHPETPTIVRGRKSEIKILNKVL